MGHHTTGARAPSRQERNRRENAAKGGQAGRKGGASGRKDTEPKKGGSPGKRPRPSKPPQVGGPVRLEEKDSR